jgi:hypothetical protein
MKILRRKEFLKEGVVLFCKGCEWVFEGLYLKTETLYDNQGEGIDFVYRNLCQIDSKSSDDLFDKYEEMMEKGSSFPINQSPSRDGNFNEKDIFLVYESKDLFDIYQIAKVLMK